MKKFLFLAIVAVTSLLASAEAGDISAGVQFNYGSKHTLMGLGANMVIEPVNKFRVSPEFVYYFKNNHYEGYNVNLNLHYIIPLHSMQNFYPIAGFSYANYKYEGLHGEDHFGANIGVGYEYRINTQFRFYVEQKFQVLSKDWNQSVTTLGLRYTF
jgi:opacity protein-like surface antigen